MKKYIFKKIFLMVLIIFTVFLGNVQITIYKKTPESLNSTEIKPSALQLNIGAWIIIGGDRESDHALVRD